MVLAALITAALVAPRVGPAGQIDAPDFRARLPPGFRYAVEAQDGHTFYRAVHAAKDAVVSVALGAAERATRCEATGEVEVQPGVRTRVTPLRTRSGVAGCIVRGRTDEGALVLVILEAPAAQVVLVSAVARGPERAEQLARAVAESVSFPPPPPVDPRVLGCFARESSRMHDDFKVSDSFIVTRRVERCFTPNHRYRAVSEALMTGGAIGSASGDPSEGRWFLRGGVLEVEGDESWSAKVGFEDEDLLLDGTRWERQREGSPHEDEGNDDD